MTGLWWRYVPHAAHFISDIADELAGGKNVLMELPAALPWADVFWETLLTRLDEYAAERVVKELPDDTSISPGEYVMKCFCKPDRQAAFRPSIGYGKFLADEEKSPLHQSFVIVRNLTGVRLHAWMAFMSDYASGLRGRGGGVFLMETPDQLENKGVKGVSVCRYVDRVGDYDAYVFYMLLASSLPESRYLQQYAAELAYALSGGDTELGCACLSHETYQDFLNDPIRAVKSNIDGVRSDGGIFVWDMNDEQSVRAVWKAQIRIIFPMVEEFRSRFIDRHREEIRAHLPIRNSAKEAVTDPGDVELGSLAYMAWNNELKLKEGEESALKTCKDARNKLAHCDVLSIDLLRKVISVTA
jgi:hypothetical protein